MLIYKMFFKRFYFGVDFLCWGLEHQYLACCRNLVELDYFDWTDELLASLSGAKIKVYHFVLKQIEYESVLSIFTLYGYSQEVSHAAMLDAPQPAACAICSCK